MNPLWLGVIGFLLGRRIRESNTDSTSRSSSTVDLKFNWSIFYSGIVATIVLVGELCISDLLLTSLHAQLPRYVGVAILVSPFLTLMFVLFLDQGIMGKFEMSTRTTDTLLFELIVGLSALGALWFGFHTGTLQPLHWFWRFLICLSPAVMFVLSSRVAEFFRRPRVRSELRNMGHLMALGLFIGLADVAGQYLFHRSFLTELTAAIGF